MSRSYRGGSLPVEVLAAIAEATARLLEPAALYEVLREQVARLVECDAFYVALYDAPTERLRFVAHTDRGNGCRRPRPRSAGARPAGSCGTAVCSRSGVPKRWRLGAAVPSGLAS